MFARAGPAEVLRSSQKDEVVLARLQQMTEEVCLNYFGSRLSMKYKPLICACAHFVYFANTTLCQLQTLGEEYTGIIQVDNTLRHVPNFMVRAVMVVLHCFGPIITKRFCQYCEKSVSRNDSLRPEAKLVLMKSLSSLKSLLPHLENVHKAFFYCNYGTYHISKRLTGTHYVLSRFWLKDRQSLPGFRVLGVITMLQSLIMGSAALVKSATSKASQPEDLPSGDSNAKCCSMCLSPLSHPTATPCGHVFCWYCIHEWVLTEPQCPNCREAIKPSRLVKLQNFG